MKEVGSLLRETRESQGFKIEQAAKELKVRSEYLEVLESGDISSLSNEIYILGYLKSYSAWLGLNSNEITNRFRSLNNELSVNKGVSHDSSFFINVEDRMISSNKPVYLKKTNPYLLLAYASNAKVSQLTILNTVLIFHRLASLTSLDEQLHRPPAMLGDCN